jgi:hypothetical protein
MHSHEIDPSHPFVFIDHATNWKKVTFTHRYLHNINPTGKDLTQISWGRRLKRVPIGLEYNIYNVLVIIFKNNSFTQYWTPYILSQTIYIKLCQVYLFITPYTPSSSLSNCKVKNEIFMFEFLYH